MEYATLCTGSTQCAGHFSLTFAALDLGALQSTLLGTSEGGELLRQLLDRIGRQSVSGPIFPEPFRSESSQPAGW